MRRVIGYALFVLAMAGMSWLCFFSPETNRPALAVATLATLAAFIGSLIAFGIVPTPGRTTVHSPSRE